MPCDLAESYAGMKSLCVGSTAWRNLLHQESAKRVSLLRFRDSGDLVVVSTNDSAVFYDNELSIVLSHKLGLMGKVIFKFFLQNA